MIQSGKKRKTKTQKTKHSNSQPMPSHPKYEFFVIQTTSANTPKTLNYLLVLSPGCFPVELETLLIKRGGNATSESGQNT